MKAEGGWRKMVRKTKVVHAQKSGRNIVITIPKWIVEQLKIVPGTIFLIDVEEDRIVLRKVE